MVENIIILGLFLTAVGYVGNMVRKSFENKDTGCAKGCGTCAVATTPLKKQA